MDGVNELPVLRTRFPTEGLALCSETVTAKPSGLFSEDETLGVIAGTGSSC